MLLKRCDKPAQQINSHAVQTSHIMYCWEHWYSQWFVTQSGGCTRDA